MHSGPEFEYMKEMNGAKHSFLWLLAIASAACNFTSDSSKASQADSLAALDTNAAYIDADTATILTDTASNKLTLPEGQIDTRGVHPQQVIDFAKSLTGTPYLYGSTDPARGFDCSGFITHVFAKFDIVVPRSSIDFTNVGKEVPVTEAKPGDLILFTGTNPDEKFVGHMGIVVENNARGLAFIHSTSGKAYGVTITPLHEGYKKRYVKTIRIFPQNG